MRPLSVKLFLLAIFIWLSFRADAQISGPQTCNGSLGDPIINQDFGSGTNPGLPLGPGITNMTYTTNNCPNDGEYTIANSLTGAGNCHPNTWQNVTSDHTGNPNGYMMIVNASYAPSIFFTQTASGLCPSTTYSFSSYILNLITLAASGPNISEPNIIFSIETTSGQVLATTTTGVIPSTSSPQWNQYGTFFTTPANVTDVVVKMTNLAPGGNGNDLILDDITFRACGPVIQSGFASVTGPVQQSLCEGGAAKYTLRANVVGVTTPSYQWQLNYYGKGWQDIDTNIVKPADTLNVGFLNAIAGVYQYRLGVSNGSNSPSCRVYSNIMTVTVTPLPVVPPFAPQTICEGSTLTLTASGGANYIWSGPNMAPTMQNPLIINNVLPTNAGTYSVVAMSAEGCAAPSVPVVVNVIPKVIAAIDANPPAICAGESVPLSASGGTIYKWTPSAGLNRDDIPNPIATPSATTTYTVTVSNNAVCTGSTKSVTVTVNQNPVADAGSDIKLFEGQSVKLNGTVKGDQITSVFWTPATALSDPLSPTPIANPMDNITYTLHVISQSCGFSTSSVYIRVFKKITVPNAFSPNSDGINDLWNIKQLTTYPESLIQIFNRYGQQVFQSMGYSKPWDGTVNGAPLPRGTYYYVIDLRNDIPKIAGWVELIK